ncbi:unnamed protein product [Kuraishia capsulata CBS 1993]|uniref:Ribosomal protein L13 n=1 Tax=Kuraishia capsulata CBS 1993 TaxID=1382522 RepID=W6MS51_9ASCO|nr:uncharacterized protein KUCA_T00005216001 [Kuraishia capsulata CBS 1993]CDK29228.1 unnamed protein product [Kuraishia capsulata CBS 1993]
MSNKIGNTAISFARVWHHVDISEDPRTMGRIATQVAIALMGKHKPIYHETQDVGDYVVVSNCSHLKITNPESKTYFSHTTRPGSAKHTPLAKLAADSGYSEVFRRAVSKMLPKNKHRWSRLARLKCVDGSEHPYKNNLIAFADEQPEVVKKLAELEHKKKIQAEYDERIAGKKF